MSTLSLTGALNIFKTPTYADNYLASQRILVPTDTLCYNWQGADNAGRNVYQNNYSIRDAGCMSPLYTMTVESIQRPKYVEWMNTGGYGIEGQFSQPQKFYSGYTNERSDLSNESISETNGEKPAGFGLDLSAKVRSYAYDFPVTSDTQDQRSMSEKSQPQIISDKLFWSRNRSDAQRYLAGL